MPRLFAVLFTMTTFCRPKWPRRLFAVFFWLLTKLEDKKGCATFCCPFGDFLASKTQKRTAKGHAAFFVLQKDAKKTPKGRRANFVLHLVGNLFWTPKGRLCKKDGKKSWHLHSALVLILIVMTENENLASILVKRVPISSIPQFPRNYQCATFQNSLMSYNHTYLEW